MKISNETIKFNTINLLNVKNNYSFKKNIYNDSKDLLNDHFNHRNYFIAFCSSKSKYSAKNDTQLNNIRKNYNAGNIKIDFTDRAKTEEKELINDFLSGKDKKIKIHRILGSNGTTYIIQGKKNNTVVIKSQHIKQDGTYPDMVTRLKCPDFDTEYYILNRLPDNINSTKLLGNINISGENERHLLAISFINSKRLSESVTSLSSKNLKDLYKSFFELDKEKIYHRDLNATNLVVEKGTNKIYILDYGSAKTFDKIHELEKNANDIYYKFINKKKQNPNDKEQAELKNLLKTNIKYRNYGGLELSNLENFEALGLLPVLMIMNKNLPLTNGKRILNSTDKLFLEHLKLSADYHKKRLSILDKNSQQYKNEEILASALSLISSAPNSLTNDIANIELLRIKLAFLYKVSRLYTDNDKTNYKIAAYWVEELGATAASSCNNLDEKAKKYKNDKLLSDYIRLNKNIADFYKNEVYPLVHEKIFSEALETYTENNNKFNNDRAIQDGHWLEKNSKIFAPSIYTPKSLNERINGIFDFF